MKPPIPILGLGLLPLLLLGLSGNVLAIPNTFFGNGNFIGPVIPAMPVFKADLTKEFFEVNNWEKGDFPGPWIEEPALAGQPVQKMTALPTLFGAVPMAVYAYGTEDSATSEIAIHFLDAGLYFGYLQGGEKTRDERLSGSDKRSDFAHHFRRLTGDLRSRLDRGCGRGKQGTIGRSDELRTVFTQYQWENFVIRLVNRPGHSVSLYILREDAVPHSFVEPSIEKMNRNERGAWFASKVATIDHGDHIIEGVPIFTQGNTPFCAIHSLAMTSHFLGLRVHPETLAAGAEFLNTGSARGSGILDLYRGVGEEIDMRVRTSSRFDLSRARKSIKNGLPMIVWRRVSREREAAHTAYQKAFQKNPALPSNVPSDKERQQFPRRDRKGSPSHASVVTGFNAERQEVIFSEPWGEAARNRRMRVEEMEATVYAVFYFNW